LLLLQDDLVASFLLGLEILVLFLVEEAFLVGVEALLLLDVHAHGDEEAEESDEGNDESKDLPGEVVASISVDVAGFGVDSDISGEVPHHEGPEAPGDEVLDREGPPSDENVEPPLVLLVGVLVVSLSDLEGEVVGSVEEDSLSPLLSVVVSGLDDERDDPSDDHEHPEDEDTVALERSSFLGSPHGEDGNGSHDNGTGPVDSGDNHGGVSALVSEDVAGLEEPSSGGTLSHS